MFGPLAYKQREPPYLLIIIELRRESKAFTLSSGKEG